MMHSCHGCKAMDNLHRQHIARLQGDLSTCAEMEQFLVHGSHLVTKKLTEEIGLWKLGAFAGWFTVALLILGDLMGWGR